MRSTRFLAALALCLGAGGTVHAACEAPGYRQFDFWLGDWDVTGKAGKLAGRNHISAAHDGCVLNERYRGASGYTGESLNIYDAGRDRWHQTWVDNTGRLLVLEGGWDGSHMRMEGQSAERDGRVARHRITWTPQPDGSVRQHWEAQDAEGAWQTLFDGSYRKRAQAAGAPGPKGD